jgi:NADPH:quinone reductase-like Zn-dependent oxidoreductase
LCVPNRATRFEDDLEPVDVVIDTVGGEVQRRSLSVLKPGGILVSAVSKPDPQEAKRRNGFPSHRTQIRRKEQAASA